MTRRAKLAKRPARRGGGAMRYVVMAVLVPMISARADEDCVPKYAPGDVIEAQMCHSQEYQLCNNKKYGAAPQIIAELTAALTECRARQAKVLPEARRRATEKARAEAAAAKAESDAKARADAQAEAEATARNARLEALANDPRTIRFAWSANLCSAQKQRADAKAAIADEQKYAREGGGIVDKEKLYDLQNDMREADKRIAASKTSLKNFKLTALPCTDKQIQDDVLSCFEDGNFNTDCTDDRLQSQFGR